MKLTISVIVGVWAIAGAAYALVTVGSPAGDIPAIAFFGPAFVVSAGLLAYSLKQRRALRTGSTKPDSVERALATRAQAATLIDALIGGCALGLVLLVSNVGISGPAAILLMVVAMLCDFWIRYGMLRRRAGRN